MAAGPAVPEPAKRARRRSILLGIAAVLGVGAAVLVAGALWALYSLPLPQSFTDPARVALDLEGATGKVFAVRGVAYGEPVELSRLPKHLVDAFVVMEDRRFFEHGGLDLRGVFRAGARNLSAGQIEQGGSTITQQLVKNLFLTPEKTFLRKAQEALLALWVEHHSTKEEILARYLDTVYLGAGAYGVEAASRRYFGKPAEDVTLSEAALLAALVPAPSRLAPTTDRDAARERTELVLDAMVEQGAITPEQAEEARSAPARLAMNPADAAAFGYAADWAAAEAREMLGGISGDFVVETTIEPTLQRLASRVIRDGLAEGAADGVSEAALVAMRPDGRVVALAGGRDYGRSQFNRATQAERQPGSVFKLFVYLTALEQGFGPRDSIEDAPITIDGWSPENYAGRYLGTMSLARAFARSSNAAAVRLQERVGRKNVISLARRMGITSELAPRPSLALGSFEVTLLEITAAFAAVRAHAERVEPWVVKSMQSGSGATFRPRVRSLRAAPWPEPASLELLEGVIRTGTGRAAALDVPAYAKTGTTQEYRDAWFVGFAEDLVVGVWVGNDDGTPMRGVTGGKLPARIWHAFTSAALGDLSLLLEAEAAEEGEALPDDTVIGVPTVVDTGTFQVAGRTVLLEGVQGLGGRHAAKMDRYVGGREIVCQRTDGDRHRCAVDGWDLSQVVLFNGGGRATEGAPQELVEAERKARREGRGVWGE